MFSHLSSSRICVAALILYGQWVHAGAIGTPADAKAALLNKPTKTIDFSSALLIEASLAAQSHQSNNIPAIPVSDDVRHIPEYDTVRRLAPAWPPTQEGINLPDSRDMISQYLSAKTNNSASAAEVGSALDSRQGGLKVMVAGDSMTQGLEGDWTWRYRLWQWFKQNGINVQFVGPYKGTVPAAKPSQPQPPPLYGTPPVSSPYPDNGGYAKGADSAFLSNSNHFAIWGRAAAVSKGLVKAAMQQSPADVMLIMLGFNDMGWFYSDAYGTIDSVGTLIANARSVNPNIKFAVATVPQRTFIGGREDLVENTNIYNNLLPSSIAKWTTSQSPVYLVDLAKNYDCRPGGCEAGYDGLHPNAWGEFEIASAFTKTLVKDFKLGSGPLAVPDRNDPSLVRDLPAPSNFQVFSSPQGVTATWDPVYGAHSYDITVTINGGPNAWSATTSQSNRWDSQWSIDGWNYAVSVRASAGDGIKGPYTVSKTAVAKPQLAPPPDNINVKATAGGITVTWNPPTGAYSDSIVEYNVIYWDWKADHCQYISGAAFKSSPAVITNLTPGTNYLVAVVTWNKNGQGFPFSANNAVPGAGTPAVPSGLVVQSQDQTSVRITWSGSALAGGYRVWSRNIKEAGSKFHLIGNVTEETCNEQYLLFPGVWNYAFAVSAFNGNDETVTGPEVVAPSTDVQAGKGTGPKCPVKGPWCPGGASFSIPPGSPTPTVTVPGGSQPTSTDIPFVGDGYCSGPDCEDGKCTDILCASLGCSGADCSHGRCIGPRCIAQGCIGPNCRGGVCVGDHCITKGCIGPDCDPGGHERCKGFKCIAIGCLGVQCGGNGICFGPSCSETTCSGPNCLNGKCEGAGCQSGGEEPGGDPCDADLSPDIGLCPNGNFPLYDPSSNTINCDVPDGEIPLYLSECQEEADDNKDDSVDEIECEKQGCPVKARRSVGTTGGYLFEGNYTDGAELFNLTRRQGPPKKQCPVPPPPSGPGAVKPGRTECDRVFQCDTDLWPNVCNNAASAQALRAKPTVLTYMGPDARQSYVTNQWWRTHGKLGNAQEHDPKVNGQRDSGSLPGQPHGGWGLIGCEVEEYPFGNSLSPVAQNQRGKWDNRAVLRLIPWEENRDHGNALARFIRNAIKGDLPQGLQGLSATGGWTYCVDITGSKLDKTNYLLDDDQSKNRCGQPYGPGYLLVNDVSAPEARQYPRERKWDPWFDKKNQLFKHTIYSSGASIATMMLPSQYGKFPAPGMKTYLRNSNKWTTAPPGKAAVGTAIAAGHPGKTGQNLKYDTPGVTHQGIKRSIDITDLGYDPRTTAHPASITAPPKYAMGESPATTTAAQPISMETPSYGPKDEALLAKSERFQKRKRALGGSFLDVDVYRKAFQCEIPYEDPCVVGDCFEGGVVYDANGGIADSGSADQSGPNGEDSGDPPGPPPPAPSYFPCSHQDADPGLGINSAYCVCDHSTFAEQPNTIQSPYNSCAYTAKPTHTITNPRPAPTYFPCSHQDADPGLGINSAYCVCDHSTFAEQPNTSQSPYNSCAFIVKPTKTIANPRTTTTASPPKQTISWGWFIKDERTVECVDAHCRTSDSYSGYALPIDNPCNAKDGYQAQDEKGLFLGLNAYADVMTFNRGVCGSPAPYKCTRTAKDSDFWDCTDSHGGTYSSCTLTDEKAINRPQKICTGTIGSGITYTLTFKCSTSSSSINCQ